MSGGGTAGHVYPALAVAEQFVAERDDVLFVGTPNGLEARLVPEAGVSFRALAAAGFDRAKPWTLVTSGARIAASALRAWWWMGNLDPDVVIGFGGYVSIPVGVAAALRHIPLVIHEQNSVPGLANRMLSRFADAVCVTYEESGSYLARPERIEHTGNPVRADVLRSSREEGRRAWGVADDEVLLVAFGGSRGARHLNTALAGAAHRLLGDPQVRVVHIAGPAEAEGVRTQLEQAGGDAAGRWHIVEYVDEMGDLLAAADLVVARAGATTIAELTALGRASVLVPYPYATDDHQTKNASTLVEHGAAVVFADAELDGEAFPEALCALLGDAAARATMAAASRGLGRPDAASRVAQVAARFSRFGQDNQDTTEAMRG